MSLEYWFMFPVSIGIATVAMASGVEGATFFTPIFILLLGLEPAVAIGTGLITEVFGFASGLVAYYRRRLIDYRLGGALLVVTVPMALAGTWLATLVDAGILKAVLGVGLLAVAVSFLRSPKAETVQRLDADIESESREAATRVLTTAQGETIRYSACNRMEGAGIAGIGALFLGMVSTGLGEMNGYFLLKRCRVPSKVAVATSVLVVAVSALAASIGHVTGFLREGGSALNTVMSLVIFTVPGVVIGGQLGSLVASRISQHFLERALGILFLMVALLLLGPMVM